MARPRAADHFEKRNAILAQAAELVARHGHDRARSLSENGLQLFLALILARFLMRVPPLFIQLPCRA